MGMKSKSNHFGKGNGGGGPSTRQGGLRFKTNLQMFAEMPKKRSQIMHIMRNSEGHLIDTPHNRKIIVDMTNEKSSFVGINKFGNEVYSKTVNGVQYWAYVRNDIIQDAGANYNNHRDFKKEIKKGGK